MGGGGEGWVIQSKVNLVPQKIFNETSNFWPNVSKILSKCIPELAQQVYSRTGKRHILRFHVCCFSNNRYDWIKIFMWYLYFEFQIKKKYLNIGQKPYRISLFFYVFNYKHWRSLSFVKVLLEIAVCKATSS